MKNTTLGYIEYDGKFLMLLRDVNKNDGSLGKWLGIGGKLEKKENADEGFIREVMEETGISLSLNDIKRRGIVDFKSFDFGVERMFLYTAKVDSDYFNPECNEGTLKWINKSKILELNMWQGDFVFLNKILSDDSFFVTSLVYGGESGDELREIVEDKLILTDVDSLDDENLSLYTRLNETNLKHIYEPKEGVFIAETPVVIDRAIENEYKPESFLCEHRLLFDLAKYDYTNAPMYSSSSEILCEMTGYGLTHGMLSVMRRKPANCLSDILDNSEINNIVILENVVNPTNVGAIVRSAVALGADAMIITKGTADPLYRRAIRVSMGNIFDLPYVIVEDDMWIEEVKKAGFNIISMALSDTAINLNDPEIIEIRNKKSAIVFGTESTGISDDLLNKSDYIVKIPMQKSVDSLNVAAASAVAFYALCN